MLRVSRRLAACLSILASAQAAVDVSPATAPRMEFTPLAPGTYQLQAIQSVEDATLLDERARPVRLSALTKGKITLLTFFYTYCVDPLGCPFAHQTLTLLRDRILRDRELAREVRFVGISCDPGTDTPDVLARYAMEFTRGSRLEWRFLTARSVSALLPVLDDFGLPRQKAGVTDVPGLAFVGTPWLVDMGSANLIAVARDAGAVVGSR